MRKLKGVTVAMVTPYTSSGDVDIQAVKRLTEFLIGKGVDGLYPCGTTGEMLHLQTEERKRILEGVLEQNHGRIPVYAHVGAATTKETVELARHAKSAGADGIGVVTPQFFKITREELIGYFCDVAEAVGEFPMYLYNIPQCSGNDLPADVCRQVAKMCGNVVGIKYSFGDMGRTLEYLKVQDGQFEVLHGMDKIFASLLVMGCSGTVSGCAGVFPEPYVGVYRAYQEHNLKEMERWQRLAAEIGDILHNGENMSYFKSALEIRGLPVGGMRLPQRDISSEERKLLETQLQEVCRREHMALYIGEDRI